MIVTLLKCWDKTPQLVSISNTSHSGLLNLQPQTDTAITALLKAHAGLEFTNLQGIMFNSWQNLKWVRKWDLATPAMYSVSFCWKLCACLCCQSVCLSACLSVFSLLRCLSRHFALCFGRSLSTLHSCVDMICDVVLSLPHARFYIPCSCLSVIK